MSALSVLYTSTLPVGRHSKAARQNAAVGRSKNLVCYKLVMPPLRLHMRFPIPAGKPANWSQLSTRLGNGN